MMTSNKLFQTRRIFAFAMAAVCVVFIWTQHLSDTSLFVDRTRQSILKLLDISHTQSSACDKTTQCRMRQLRTRIDDVCQYDPRVIHDRPRSTCLTIRNVQHKLIYFSIPKVGCSFWKRVFKVLNSVDEGDKHLFDIPSHRAHDGLSSLKVSKKERDNYLLTHTSFMVVRDPFSRLFSGFIDKMFVPNSVGMNHIRRMFRKEPDLIDKPCQYNISFEQFTSYISFAILNRSIYDVHFVPMWQQCNPCDVNVTYVAKMETFMDDASHILSSVGIDIDEVLGVKGDSVDETNEKGIMQDVAARTFAYVNVQDKDTLCMPRTEILRRLWMIYQIRGFISKDQHLPSFNNADEVSLEEFVAAAYEAYDNSGPKSKRQLQREEAMNEAFSNLPRPILMRLSQAFDMDCRLFEYDCNVVKRFLMLPKIRETVYLKMY